MKSTLLSERSVSFCLRAGLLVLAGATTCAISGAAPRPTTRPFPRVPRQFSISPKVYVPVGLRLRLKDVPRAVENEEARLYGDRTPILNEIIRQAPKYFPPGAKAISVKTGPFGKNYFDVDLSRAFGNQRFWRGLGRRRTNLALHALAREVAFQYDGKGQAMSVRFLIEGKRIASIGAFNSSRLLHPDKIIRPS